MNDETGEQMRSSRRQSLSLGSLYLDPNNFQFADHPDYRLVPPEAHLRCGCAAAHDQLHAGAANRKTFGPDGEH